MIAIYNSYLFISKDAFVHTHQLVLDRGTASVSSKGLRECKGEVDQIEHNNQ